MAAVEAPTAAPTPAEDLTARARQRWFQVVLVGLVLLVVGFTATLVSNAFYPCVPSAGSHVQPPLGDCAVALSPGLGLALVGLLLAVLGYRRVG